MADKSAINLRGEFGRVEVDWDDRFGLDTAEAEQEAGGEGGQGGEGGDVEMVGEGETKKGDGVKGDKESKRAMGKDGDKGELGLMCLRPLLIDTRLLQADLLPAHTCLLQSSVSSGNQKHQTLLNPSAHRRPLHLTNHLP